MYGPGLGTARWMRPRLARNQRTWSAPRWSPRVRQRQRRAAGLDRGDLGGPPHDCVVLEQGHPAGAGDLGKPGLVLELLAPALAVDVGHRVDGESGVAQRVRDLVAAQGPVDEELSRRRGRVGGRGAPTGPAHCSLLTPNSLPVVAIESPARTGQRRPRRGSRRPRRSVGRRRAAGPRRRSRRRRPGGG